MADGRHFEKKTVKLPHLRNLSTAFDGMTTHIGTLQQIDR